MKVATTRHELRIATTSRNIENKQLSGSAFPDSYEPNLNFDSGGCFRCKRTDTPPFTTEVYLPGAR
jgi:hypothetical protein